MDDAELLGSIRADIRVAGRAFSDSPEAAVVHCPGWTLTDLVGHHGGVVRWAEAIVRTGEPVVEQFAPPAGLQERLEWYLEAAERFVTTASSSDRDRNCWTFGRPPGRLWFWIRRQALEAAVHRWDAELAIGSPNDLATDLACLGVTEVVEDLFPRQVALGRTPEMSCAVELRAEDADQTWILSPQARHQGAVLSASASVLVLLLWKRAALNEVSVSFAGPPELFDELRSAHCAP